MVEKSRYNLEEKKKVYMHGLRIEKVGPNVSNFSAMLVSFAAAWVEFTRRRLVLCLQVTQKYCS